MPVDFTLIAPGTDQDVTQTYQVYLRREVDGAYWDVVDSSFKPFGSLGSGLISLTEDPGVAGVWTATIATGAGDTGVYRFLPRDGLTGTLLTAQAERVYLVAGARTVEADRAKVMLSHHYATYDALQLLDNAGEPVEGAVIRVYTKAAYDAGDTTVALGVTRTDAQGRWVSAVPVTRPGTYVVHYHKTGVIGPTDVEVIVA